MIRRDKTTTSFTLINEDKKNTEALKFHQHQEQVSSYLFLLLSSIFR